jgi:hypothetical protein
VAQSSRTVENYGREQPPLLRHGRRADEADVLLDGLEVSRHVFGGTPSGVYATYSACVVAEEIGDRLSWPYKRDVDVGMRSVGRGAIAVRDRERAS